ncbi:MAG: enoyl-CoA hydratase [Alphaproteobacteria bacterium]|nr:MAG: enoyl-CoA hydratase [Alphaproteobacteria bacterium]
MSYETILLDKREAIGIITLNRPQALNAFNKQLMDELTQAVRELEADDEIGCMIITGSEKAFAAGADIKEIADKSYAEVLAEDLITANWEEVTRARKPVIAAVAGYALGGGCELAMMCDIVIAAENARFGQPEITIGVIPGAGGTQRLTRAIGKAMAMDMILTGRQMDAREALAAGLVSRVVPTEDLMDEAIKIAERIAAFSRPAVMIAKEAVNRAFETTLAEGVRFERRVFHSLFAFEDQKEGMQAFIEKRRPQFRNR